MTDETIIPPPHPILGIRFIQTLEKLADDLGREDTANLLDEILEVYVKVIDSLPSEGKTMLAELDEALAIRNVALKAAPDCLTLALIDPEHEEETEDGIRTGVRIDSACIIKLIEPIHQQAMAARNAGRKAREAERQAERMRNLRRQVANTSTFAPATEPTPV